MIRRCRSKLRPKKAVASYRTPRTCRWRKIATIARLLRCRMGAVNVRMTGVVSICTLLVWLALSPLLQSVLPEPVDVGDRRQLLLDATLFERADRVSFQVHAPEPREVAVRCDRPWERKVLHYSSIVTRIIRNAIYVSQERNGHRLQFALRNMVLPAASCRESRRKQACALQRRVLGVRQRQRIRLFHSRWNRRRSPAGSEFVLHPRP